VTDWNQIFLGVIAIATLIIALGQVALLITASRLARQLATIANVLEQELKPLFAQIQRILTDASKAVALATAQMERVDQLFADLVTRCDAVAGLIQDTLSGPLRQGSALLAAFRTALSVLRERTGRRRSRQDDEDALFI